MKKIILSALFVSLISMQAMAASNDLHKDHVKDLQEEKKMGCMCKKDAGGEMLPISKDIVESLVKENLLPNLKDFTLVKTEKNGQGYDIFLKDSKGNNFKISLKGHLMASGLQTVKE